MSGKASDGVITTILSLWWFVPYGRQTISIEENPRAVVSTELTSDGSISVSSNANRGAKLAVAPVTIPNVEQLVVRRTCCCCFITHSWATVTDIEVRLEPVCAWWGLLRFFIYFVTGLVMGMLIHMVPAQIMTPQVSLGSSKTHQALGIVWAVAGVVTIILIYVLRPRGVYIKGTWGRGGCSQPGRLHESFIPLTTRPRSEQLLKVRMSSILFAPPRPTNIALCHR